MSKKPQYALTCECTTCGLFSTFMSDDRDQNIVLCRECGTNSAWVRGSIEVNPPPVEKSKPAAESRNPGGDEIDTNGESYVVAEILRWLAYERPEYLVWRQNTGAMHSVDTNTFVRFGLPGQPDIFCIIPPNGQFLGIECKRRNGGTQTKEQKAFQRAVERVGGVYILARSVDDVMRVIGG